MFKELALTRGVDIGQDAEAQDVAVGTEGVLQLAHQGGEGLLVLLGLLVHHVVAAEDLLESLPELADAAVHLLRLVLGELPAEVEAVEAVGLHQRVGTVDERDAGVAALQKGQVLVVLGVHGVLVAAHAEQDLQGRVLALQTSRLAEQAAAQIQVQLLIVADQLVARGIDAGISVDQVGAVLQGGLQVGQDQLGEA